MEADKLSIVEDIYRPYAQKKKTRAATAIKLGLQPLADWMMSCPEEGSCEEEAMKYITEEVKNIRDALQGAMDIIAEAVSDNSRPAPAPAFPIPIRFPALLPARYGKVL